MKVNNKILYIPPYISTTWDQVRIVHRLDTRLIIILNNDQEVEIPGLSSEEFELVFTAHSNYLENLSQNVQENVPVQMHNMNSPIFSGIMPEEFGKESSLTFGFGTFDSLGSALHHNESQSNIPDMPQEILSKISAIAKIVSPEDIQALPLPELNCNCMHCQIARAIHNGLDKDASVSISPVEEEVKDEDLSFQQWDIQQVGDKLFSVTDKLDMNQTFKVFLGHPVGCTCGKEGCEHILAVLKS